MSNRSLGTPSASLSDYGVKKRMGYIQRQVDLKNKKVVDLGVGYGVYSKILAKNAEFVYGVDLNRDNFETSKKNISSPNFLPIWASADHLPFRDESIDLVICIETFEHLLNGGDVLKEIHRVLPRGGQLIITTPNRLFPFETHGIRIGKREVGSFGLGFPLLSYFPEFIRDRFATVKIYTPHSFKKLLTTQGFRIERMDYFIPNFDVISKKSPKISNLIQKFQKLLEPLEKSQLKIFGMTIICVSRKY